MRKMMTLLLALAMMVTASIASASAEHGDCPEHLAGDSNFPIVYALWHDGWYVDKSSLNVQRYDPPYYVIAVNVVTVPDAAGGNQSMNNVKTFRFFYNIDQKGMYIDQHTGNDDWALLDVEDPAERAGLPMAIGEAAFYQAYHMKFYGSKTFLDAKTQKQKPVYDDDFYEDFN